MKARLIITGILLALFSAQPAFADVAVKAEIDKTIITIGESLSYKVTITSTEKDTPRPQIAKFDDFSVLSQSQSSSFSFTKGALKTTLEFSYILAALKQGKFKIPPAIIKIKDRTYASEEFEVEVKPGQTQPNPQPETPPSLLPQGPEKKEVPQITL